MEIKKIKSLINTMAKYDNPKQCVYIAFILKSKTIQSAVKKFISMDKNNK